MIKQLQLIGIFVVIILICGCGSKTLLVKRDSAGQYTINGKTYYPMRTVATGYTQKGVASWYGPGFHGKKTSSGEVYDMHCMTAAHSVLPLNTMVKVTNLTNNKEVVVRVNDRGPFVNDRVIDLSLAAARDLGMVQCGTVPVKVSVIGPADSTIASRTRAAPVKGLAVQEGLLSRFPNPFYSAGDKEILAKL